MLTAWLNRAEATMRTDDHLERKERVGGEVVEARGCLSRAAEPVERSGNLLPTLWIAASLGLLELSLGHPGAAWRACEAVDRRARGAWHRRAAPRLLPAGCAPGADRTGRARPCRAPAGRLEARARKLDRAWALATGARCRALLQAARSDLATAAEALDRALADHERIDMPFELARTLLVAGAIERPMRKRTRARSSFEQALAIFEDVGAQQWAGRARAELTVRGFAARRARTSCQRRARIAPSPTRAAVCRAVGLELLAASRTRAAWQRTRRWQDGCPVVACPRSVRLPPGPLGVRPPMVTITPRRNPCVVFSSPARPP